MDDSGAAATETEPAEVAVAYDGVEALFWLKQLEALGIEGWTERRGGWLKAILYLGRWPVSIQVARRDLGRAREHLMKYRFIKT